MKALQVFYSGHVQGVGFRYTVKQIAKGFDVTGWIRNLPDRRVELQASAEEAELDAFLVAIAESELRAHIREQTATPLTQPPVASGFEIRHG
ncbi:acylphosphatase [soil metagenome]